MNNDWIAKNQELRARGAELVSKSKTLLAKLDAPEESMLSYKEQIRILNIKLQAWRVSRKHMKVAALDDREYAKALIAELKAQTRVAISAAPPVWKKATHPNPELNAMSSSEAQNHLVRTLTRYLAFKNKPAVQG